MKEQSISQRTIKNSLFSLLVYIWPIVFTIFVTPFIIHKIGLENFGLFILVSVITGFSSLLNFGTIFSLIKELSIYPQQTSNKRIEEVLGATLVIFFIVGFLFLILVFIFARFGLNFFKISPLQYKTAAILFYLAGFIGFFNSISAVYAHIIYALQRLDIATKVNIINITLYNITVIIFLTLGYGVIFLVLAQVVSSFFLLVVYYIYSRRLLPDIRAKFRFEKSLFISIFSSGFLSYIHNVSLMFLIQIDKVMIGSMLGPSSLTFYSLPGTVAEKIQGIVTSLSNIFFPVSSQLAGVQEKEKIKFIYQRSMRTVALLAAAMSISIIIFARKILELWVGAEIADKGTPILYWLTLTYFFLSLFVLLSYFLMGLSKLKFLALGSFSMAVLNLILNFILIPKYSIIGAAMAYFFSLAPLIIIFYYAESRFLNIKNMGRFYFFLFAKLSATSVLFYLLINFFILDRVNDLLSLIVFGPLSVIIYIFFYKIFSFFPEEDWNLFKNFSKGILNKLNFFKA